VGFGGFRKPGRAALVFHEPSVLTPGPDSTSRLNIALGCEYFIVLYTETAGMAIATVTGYSTLVAG